jgi:SAM-dependent methyltransferase
VQASYEAVAYEGGAIRAAEPDAIAAAAILHGLTPPPPDHARVLELGCSSGSNLVGMAFRMPKSTFLGIDLVPAQVESGQWAVSELGLRNVELQAKSILDVTDADGTFDYIICHGVYSWVPPDVQDAILRIASRNLAPNGVAYVSYNTYPGWHRRGMLRDMLLFNDDPSLDPEERVARARALTAALADADPGNASAHAVMLREEAAQLAKQSDFHLFHEQLEPWNSPVYFSEFVRRAGAHGLVYLGDARQSIETAATAAFRQALGPALDRVRMEQYLDFVRGRPFRATLLCHEHAKPSAEPLPSALQSLSVRARGSRAEPAPEDAARGPAVTAFQAIDGGKLTTNHPLLIAAINVLLDAAPAAVRFDDLHRSVTAQLTATSGTDGDTPPSDDVETLAAALLPCARTGLVEFRALPWRWPVVPTALPKASALVRWQALRYEEVTTLAHSRHTPSGLERFLLAHLDGTNDRVQLARVIERAFTSGDLALPNFTPTRENVSAILEDTLAHMGRSALFVA